MNVDVNVYINAIKMAVLAHGVITRKFSTTPYVIHPIRVSQTVLALTDDYGLAAAAVLHDVLEDTKVTKEEMLETFGPVITDLVVSVTKLKDLPKTAKELDYNTRFRASDYRTAILKFADRHDNLNDVKDGSLKFRSGYIRNTFELLNAAPVEAIRDNPVAQFLFNLVLTSLIGEFMSVQSILEADGSVIFSKQTDEWLKERLKGYRDTIAAASRPTQQDMTNFLAINEELQKRSV